MSQVRPDVDLSALSRPETGIAPPKRSKLRIVVPIVLLLAFAAILATTLGDLWKGSVGVTVVRPRAVDASASASSGTPLFQAAGWIEPDPFAVEVPALAAGVVSDVLVQPSDAVAAGDPVARLIERDAQLACDNAQAMLAQSQAELVRAEAELRAAQTSFDQALAVTQGEAIARAELQGKEAEAKNRKAASTRGEARIKAAEEEIKLQRALSSAGAVGPRQIDLAEARLAEVQAELDLIRADAALAEAEVEKARANLQRAARELELRIDDRERLDAARADVDAAQAKVSAVRVSCDEAKLRLERMTVRAPVAGVVLERLASPGSTLNDANAVVCTLYDPHSLRVRVDVPQGEVGKVGVGMQAEVLADSRPGQPYHGEVIRLVHKADIQKVTLQVHVKLRDADPLLRPEMLAQVRFLSSGPAAGAAATSSSTVLLVPSRLIVHGSHVWVIEGSSGTAAMRPLDLGGVRGDEVEVKSGLNASDKLIDQADAELHEGVRVRIRGE